MPDLMLFTIEPTEETISRVGGGNADDGNSQRNPDCINPMCLIESLEIPIGQMPLDEQQSKFFKHVYQNPSRNPQEQFVIDPE